MDFILRTINKFILFIFLIYSLSSCKSVYSLWQKTLPIEREEYVFCDTTQKMNINQIINLKNTDFISPFPEQRISLKHNVYWIKVKLKKTYNESIMVDMHGDYNRVQLFAKSNENHIKEIKLINTNKWRYELSPYNQIQTLYFRVETPNFLVGLGFNLYSNVIFFNLLTLEVIYLGIFIGIVLISMLYTLVLFIVIRETFYLYYFLYLLSFGVYSFITKVNIHSFFGLNNLPHELYYYSIPFSFSTIFLLLYARAFLQIKEFLTSFDRLVLFLLYFKIGSLIIAILFDYQIFYNSFIDNTFIFLLLIIGILRLRQKYLPARFFVLGLAIVYIGMLTHGIIQSAKDIFGFIDATNEEAFTFSFINLSLMEIIIFSIALGDRLKIFKKENEQKQEMLISEIQEKQNIIKNKDIEIVQQVNERTQKLINDKVEIEKINNQLTDVNLKLKQDLSINETDKILRKMVSFEEFRNIFPDEEACNKFLYDLKWSEGYWCRRCFNPISSSTNLTYSKRCSKCRYVESATTNTIFNNVKFPLVKAFYILFLVAEQNKISGIYLSKILSLRRQTCDDFKKKVLERIENKRNTKNMIVGWRYLIID